MRAHGTLQGSALTARQGPDLSYVKNLHSHIGENMYLREHPKACFAGAKGGRSGGRGAGGGPPSAALGQGAARLMPGVPPWGAPVSYSEIYQVGPTHKVLGAGALKASVSPPPQPRDAAAEAVCAISYRRVAGDEPRVPGRASKSLWRIWPAGTEMPPTLVAGPLHAGRYARAQRDQCRSGKPRGLGT